MREKLGSMRFFHLADLHIGKTVNGFSMLEDQRHILGQVLALAQEHRPDALVLAGDIYDRVSPGAYAVRLYDAFLTDAARQGLPVLVVAGNHDSADRLGFAGRILQESRVYSFGPCTGSGTTVTLGAGDAETDFTLLPFVRPGMVRRFFPEERLDTHHDAVRLVLENTPLRPGVKNVLVAHQFVVAGGERPATSDSEVVSVGGTEEVDAALFDAFDYVALGHLHGPQRVGREAVRYAGSPLKYSFSERHHQKGVTLVELGEEVTTRLLPLAPLRDMRQVEGTLDELLQPLVVAAGDPEDYLKVVLRDEEEVPDAIGKLRRAYPNVMELRYHNRRSEALGAGPAGPGIEQKSPLELFVEFYTQQNGAPPSGVQRDILAETALLSEVEE